MVGKPLEKRNIVVGVTGSIAAYKACELVRYLVTRAYNVRVVMTQSATKFVSPLTFKSLSNNNVIVDMWDAEADTNSAGISHIEIADWAEMIVVAPATADTIASLASGRASDSLQAIVLASTCPLIIAPAMNINMYSNPITQANIARLRDIRGATIVDPEKGDLACGWQGVGRLAGIENIYHAVRRAAAEQDYAGKKVLVVTGPTWEPIDPVRFISNRSSGKMGVSIAHEAYRRGAEVLVIHGPLRTELAGVVRSYEVKTATQMADAVFRVVFKECVNETCNPTSVVDSGHFDREAWEELINFTPDIVIMTAAVADYRSNVIYDQKVKKSTLKSVELVQNIDILQSLGEKRGEAEYPTLVGFAVETGPLEELLDELQRKLENKRVDMIVGNLAEEAFELDTNRVWILNRSGKREEVATALKSRVANKILNSVLKL